MRNNLSTKDDVIKQLEQQKALAGKQVEYKEQVVMLCDVSGSMENIQKDGIKKIEQLRTSLLKFFNKNKIGKLHLLAFSNSCISPPGDDFVDKVINLEPGGSTYLLPGLQQSEILLRSYPQVIHRRIVLLSDGKIAEDLDELQSILKTLKLNKIKLDAIGFGDYDDVEKQLLRSIAEYLGGSYQHADTMESLTKTLLNITTERKLLT